MGNNFNLEAEIICDHNVSKEMKKIWAVEMDILKEIQRICQKHNIKYFAAAGTLLGTIRHKGFIPWDDDIDVFMLREDYLKFCKIAPKEAYYPYFFQSCFTEKAGFSPFFSRMRRSNTTGCTMHEYNSVPQEYNCGIFVDIFPLYDVPENKILSSFQRIILKFLNLGVSGFELKRRLAAGGKLKKSYHILAVWYWNFINLLYDYKHFAELYIRISSICKNSKYVGMTGFDVKLTDSKYTFLKKWFNEIVEKPFENMFINCPKDYDSVLKRNYGNYTVFKKGTAIHTFAVIDADTPFKKKLYKSK